MPPSELDAKREAWEKAQREHRFNGIYSVGWAQECDAAAAYIAALEADRAEREARIDSLGDEAIHYRNLAIEHGAPPEQMLDDYDRRLCSTWVRGDPDPDGWQAHAQDAPDNWKQIEILEAGIAEVLALHHEITRKFHNDDVTRELPSCALCAPIGSTFAVWPCPTRRALTGGEPAGEGED